MRCETSFFSLTLFKKQLKRYWPMWAVWMATWTLVIPVTLWNGATYWNHAERLREVAEIVDVLPVMSVCIAVAAPVVAVAVFFHLFRSPAANFVGALPLRREGVFATAFAAGYTMLIAPLVAVCLITFLVEWAIGAVAVAPLLQWLGGCMLASFFWFSFAVLCCVISGNAVASVCFYAIFNAVVIVMTWLVQTILGIFLFGFDLFSQRLWEAVMWLTPVYKHSLNDYMLTRGLPPATRFELLWVYAAVGFLMFLAAVGLHHIRKAERAGDLIAFAPIRWIFRISVTLCGGLSFGMLLMAIIFANRSSIANLGAALAGCCAVAAMVSWFAAEMLLQKSFKVFKEHWKGAAVAAVCFVVAICAIDMDWIGFTTRVPQPGQAHGATATFNGEIADNIAREGLSYDAETVTALIDLHQYIVEHQDNMDGSYYYGRLELDYDLGLTSMRRVYHINYQKDSRLDELFRQAQRAGTPDFDVTRGTPNGGYVNWPRSGSRELTALEAERLWAAIQTDVKAGRYRAGEGDRQDIGIELAWQEENHRQTWDWFYPTAQTVSVNAVIEELGLLRSNEDEAVATEIVP